MTVHHTTFPETPTLAGSAEIREAVAHGDGMMSVATFWRRQQEPGFPAPLAVLKQGMVWDREAVLAWFEKRAAK